MSTGEYPAAPLRNGSTPPNSAPVDVRADLARIVEEVLKTKGVPASTAQAVSTDAEQLIQQAARKVPSWVSLAFVVFGVPSLGSFVATAKSVWGMPDRVAKIEAELEAQRKIHEAQGAQLDRIERLLKVEVASHPASQPSGK